MSEESGDPKKSRLDSVLPGLFKRGVEKAVEAAVDAPADLKSFVTEMKLPKEIAHYIFSQVDETKNGLFRVVGHEVRDFLEHTNFGGEMQKILTTVQFEINTTIRFRPNDGAEKGARGKDDDDDDEDDDDDRSADSSHEGDSGESPSGGGGRPEVKTHVSVRRDRDERRGRDRGQSDKSRSDKSKGDKSKSEKSE